MSDQQIQEAVQCNQPRSVRKLVSSPTRQTGTSGATHGKRKAISSKPLASARIKLVIAPVPSDPETIHALGLPSSFRKYRRLPAYTVDGQALFGKVTPSNNYLKFLDEAPANTDPSAAT